MVALTIPTPAGKAGVCGPPTAAAPFSTWKPAKVSRQWYIISSYGPTPWPNNHANRSRSTVTQRLEPRFSLSVLVLLTGSLALAGCQGESEATQTAATSETPATTVSSPAADQPLQHSLAALPGLEAQVPELHRKSTIVMQTSAGEL